METIVFIILQIFFVTRAVLKIGKYLYIITAEISRKRSILHVLLIFSSGKFKILRIEYNNNLQIGTA